MKTLPRVRRAVVRPKLLFFWNWTPKNIPDQQKHVGFQKSKKVRNHSPYCLYIMDRRQRLVWTTVLYSNWKKTVFIIIMDPPGVFIVFYTFYMFSYTYTDTDNRTDGCCNFYLRWPRLDPGILVMCWVFPHISDSFFCRFGAIFVSPSPWAGHISCKVVFLLILTCWLTRLGVMLRSTWEQ